MSPELEIMVRFRKRLDPCPNPRALDSGQVSVHSQWAPDVLLEFWEMDGLRCYGKGLVSFVDPSEYDGLVRDHFPDKAGDWHIYLRTAFGYMFAYDSSKSECVRINPITGGTSQGVGIIPDHVDLDFDDRGALRDIHWRRLHRRAVRRYGTLEHDQCWAFVPAVLLGGTVSVKSMEKVNALAQIDFLLQLAQ